MDSSNELERARRACDAGRRVLSTRKSQPATVLSDAGRDIKLQEDRDAEAAILDVLRGSGYPILAEERGALGNVSDGGPVWVVDPLDGTMNFSRGIPFFSTAIALLVDGDPVVGVVHDVSRNETFSGAVDVGCWCDETPISVSTESDPARSILATGLPTGRDHGPESLRDFAESLGRFKKVRMLGSAALMLAYVAAGRIDAYAEDDIMLWDVAAGLALVQAAGGYAQVTPSARQEWGRHVRCSGQAAIWQDQA